MVLKRTADGRTLLDDKRRNMREQKKVQEQRQLQPQMPAGCGQTPHHYLLELRLAKA
jgi:transcriptional regulator GlxA family with amidase domain